MPGREATAKRRATGAPNARTRPSLKVVPRPRSRTTRDAAHLARVDRILLLLSSGFLTAAGLVMVLSAGSVSATQGYDGNPFWYFQRQLVYAVVGVILAVVVARLRPSIWKRLGFPLLGVTALLMLLAAHPSSGTSFYGASRWIDIGPVTLQPSEFAKLLLVAVSAAILTNKWSKRDDLGHLLVPLAPVVGVVAVLGILQRDLGTTLILCTTVFLMLFIAGVRLRYLSVAGIAGILGLAYLILGESYRRARFVEAYLRPWEDPKGDGYQLIQGLIAIGSGGWFGTGLGTSRAKWDFLPNAHSDFIFAVIGEELGLLGAIVVLIAFGVLVYAGIRIAIHAPGVFERLLAAGIIAWIGTQAIVNLGAVTGILPITGVPLPLVSFGGTALVVTLAGIGVLSSVARHSGRAGPDLAGASVDARGTRRPVAPTARKARR